MCEWNVLQYYVIAITVLRFNYLEKNIEVFYGKDYLWKVFQHTGGGDIDDLVGETFHKVITTMLTDVCLFSHFSNFIDGGFKVHLT